MKKSPNPRLTSQRKNKQSLSALCVGGPLLAIAAILGGAVGCDSKEKVLDIETPRRDVEVERDVDTGEVEVEVERKE